MSLYRDDNAVGCCQCVDGQHPQGRHTVHDGIVVVPLDGREILPQDRLPAHCVDQRYLGGGQLYVGRHQIHAVLMVQNAIVRLNGLIGDDLPHDRCQGRVQLVRLLPTEKLGEITLSICVNQKNFFTLPRKTNGQTCCRGGLADAAFLIGQCDCVHL